MKSKEIVIKWSELSTGLRVCKTKFGSWIILILRSLKSAFWQTQRNHFPTVQLFQLPSTSLLPPFVLDSPRQNCGSPHIVSLSSSPFEELTRAPTLDTWANGNSPHVFITSVEHNSLSSSACASSRTANGSISCSLCEGVSLSSVRAGDGEDNSPQGPTPVPSPLLSSSDSAFSQLHWVLYKQSNAVFSLVVFFLLRSSGLPHLMLV